MSQDPPLSTPAANDSPHDSPADRPSDRPADTAPAPITESTRKSRKRAKSGGSLLKELPVLLVVAFVLALLIKSFLVQAFFIPSGSMETTLHGCPGCQGDRVLVTKVNYYFNDPSPGDIVVFRGTDSWAPEFQVTEPTNIIARGLLSLGRAIGTAPPDEKDFVKRVVATGGQVVACCDAAGQVTVDGKGLNEPYISANNPLDSRAFGPVTVPEGRLWVMGDNRAGSADSRSHIDDGHFGTIPVDNVIGKAEVIVWPFSRATFLDSPDIQGLAAPLPAPSRPRAPDAPYAVAVAAVLPLLFTRKVGRHRYRR